MMSKLFGTTKSNRRHVLIQIVHSGQVFNDQHRAILAAPYTAEEINLLYSQSQTTKLLGLMALELSSLL